MYNEPGTRFRYEKDRLLSSNLALRAANTTKFADSRVDWWLDLILRAMRANQP
jgi:hypothetical protein